jgi:hypothetical protein
MRDVPPSPDDWQALLTAAQSYQNAAPWQRLSDSPVIGVADPDADEVGYCSVLGAGGESFGLLLFLGPKGFWAYRQMASSEDTSSWDARAAMFTPPALSLNLGARDQVSEDERAVFRSLGWRFRGAHAWPVCRSIRLGYLPWKLTAREMRQLTNALVAVEAFSHLPQGIIMLEQVSRDQLDPGDGPQPVVVLRPDGVGAWTPSVSEVSPESAVAVDSTYRSERVQSLRERLPRSRDTWQMDFLPAPFGIGAARERLEASWLGLAVSEGNGLALNLYAFSARESIRPAEFLLDTLEKAGCLPSAVRVCRRDVAEGLAPVVEALGCRLGQSVHLREMESFYDAVLDA